LCKTTWLLRVIAQCSAIGWLITSLVRSQTPDVAERELLTHGAAEQRWSVWDSRTNNTYEYTGALPLIWIGGVPRSGATLIRVRLHAHSEVRYGAETRVIPRMLSMRAQWIGSAVESDRLRLREAGVNDAVMDYATASFLMEVLNGSPGITV
jgi:hypothetical protein